MDINMRKKMIPQTDFSEEIMAELSRLLAVNSGLHVTFIPLMVSPPLPAYSHVLTSFSSSV